VGEAGLDIQAQAAINTHEAIARSSAIAHSAGTGVCDDPPVRTETEAEDEGAAA